MYTTFVRGITENKENFSKKTSIYLPRSRIAQNVRGQWVTYDICQLWNSHFEYNSGKGFSSVTNSFKPKKRTHFVQNKQLTPPYILHLLLFIKKKINTNCIINFEKLIKHSGRTYVFLYKFLSERAYTFIWLRWR